MPRSKRAAHKKTGVDAYGYARSLLFEARILMPQVSGMLAMARHTVCSCDATQRTALHHARRCATLASISVQSYERWTKSSVQPRESISMWQDISDVFDDLAYLESFLGPSSVTTITAPELTVSDVRAACELPALRGFADTPDLLLG
jgi:hypothetical protein